MSSLYGDNLALNRAEFAARRAYLQSWPIYLSIVPANSCNFGCIHCYQARNGDGLLKPEAFGRAVRREFAGLYPYLSVLRLQGGEVFAMEGFSDLLDDVAATLKRPILSVSTNGSLIDDAWAERLVRTPFRSVTISIDAATPETFARLRRGGDLPTVLGNIGRIVAWKERLGSSLPDLDSFFVVMRSNFREIPAYFDLMAAHGVTELALQTVEINVNNRDRATGEAIEDPAEIRELHVLLWRSLPEARARFRAIRLSGLRALFEGQGLESAFLEEEAGGLYPGSEGEDTSGLCPNPWKTLFVAENGGVHLCFLSEPIGNLYETPLAALWNSRPAIAKRALLAAGQYLGSGCSRRWCSWREGRAAEFPKLKDLAASEPLSPPGMPEAGELPAVRRLVQFQTRRIAELEALQEPAQRHIDHLEEKAARLERDFRSYRRSWLVRAAHRLARLAGRG